MLYVHWKTLGVDKTDCMITYINYYYPNGCEYTIQLWEKNEYHIDKCWMENEYMTLDSKVNGCNLTNAPLINMPYCYYTLMFENLWNKLK